jgi:glycosyltransferase involved in cell wall biosynthesis
MAKTTLSAVIITFNEERNIERCLKSIEKIADEIIIVDSFSSDKTLSLVSGVPKVKVHQREWAGFSNAKNFANDLATGDFILSIDADEELSPEVQESIAGALGTLGLDESCEVNRLTNYCGKWIRHSGWYPEYKTRIFPRQGTKWKGTLHEELVFSNPLKTRRLKGHLLHYSYPTVDSHLSKIIAYASLAVTKDIAAGKRYTFVNHGLTRPFFVFVRKYFFQAGFLDGYYGFVIAVNSAYERFLRYARYRELRR